MNLSTLLGVLAGFVMLSWAVLSQTGLYKVFVNPPGMAIVLGGVICSILVAYRRCCGSSGSYSCLCARKLRISPEWCGLLPDFREFPVRRKEDNAKPIENRRIRELAEAHIFHTMARFAPAFGMVGTLVGLIGMLVNMGKGNLADMGQNMAVALVTTFYGLILTNLVFRPIAVQIERRMEESLRLMTMVMEGVLMIHQKWHPYKVEDYLNSFLPPGRREVAVRRYQEREELK